MKSNEKRPHKPTPIYIRGVPPALRARLERMAKVHNRSLNGELVTVLEAAADAFDELARR